MKSTLITALALVASVTLPLAAHAEGGLPWLPIPGQLLLGLQHAEQSGDTAYIGAMELPLATITGGAASKFRRTTTTVRLGYGLNDALALEGSFGSARVKAGAADSDSGRADSTVGLAWRVLDEFEHATAPTVTVRALAILKGSYEGDRLAALGNAENGIEAALLIGKQFGPVGLWAELGVQDRSGSVPNANFYEIGARTRLGAGFGASLSFASKKYGGDLDIGGPGFGPARFQEVRAERELIELGLSYAFAANQGLALNLAKVQEGRNTVKDDQIATLSYTFAF
jgi:hypothetical protein